MNKSQKVSRKQEMRITKSLNEIKEQARRQMASGALWFAKSDVVSKLFQIEAKTRAKPSESITIKKSWLNKVEQEGFDNKKTPALAFSFGDGTDYFILRDRDFYALVEELNSLRGGSGEE